MLCDLGDFRAASSWGISYAKGDGAEAEPHLRRALELFDDADIAPEMREAIRGTLKKRLAAIEDRPGPPHAGTGANSPRDE